MEKTEIQREREFLHSLINLLTKAHGRTKINVLKIKSNQNLSPDEILENSEKTLAALDEMMSEINQHRIDIIDSDNFVPDAEIAFNSKKIK